VKALDSGKSSKETSKAAGPTPDTNIYKQTEFAPNREQPIDPKPNPYAKQVKATIKEFRCGVINSTQARVTINIHNADRSVRSFLVRIFIRYKSVDTKRNDRSLWYEFAVPPHPTESPIEPNQDFEYSATLNYSCNSYTVYFDDVVRNLSVAEVLGVEFADSPPWVEENSGNPIGATIVTGTKGNNFVRTDGIWVSHPEGYPAKYLRFYDDYTVISISSLMPLTHTFKYFNKKTYIPFSYTLDNTGIHFVMRNDGVVTYDCHIAAQDSKETLACDIYSSLNNRRFQAIYEFIPLPKNVD
jgi:hypothetical protein